MTNAERNDELNQRLAADMYAEVERTVRNWTDGVISGRGKEVVNPFTNQRTSTPVPDEAKALHDRLAEAGVLGSEQLTAALRAAIKGLAHAAVFGVLAAIDGSGEFDSGARVGLTVDDEPIEPFLHEVYFESGADQP
jgi:hypothetical protein